MQEDAIKEESRAEALSKLGIRLDAAMVAHDEKTPHPTCVSCKLLYPISKRLDRKGIFFPCAKHFTCWYCAEFMLREYEERGYVQEVFRCPGSRSCTETISMNQAVERVRGSTCLDCSSVCFPQGNQPPLNVLDCPNCFRCLRCSAAFAKNVSFATSASTPIYCPSKECSARLDTSIIDVLAQRRCAVCLFPAKSEDEQQTTHSCISACGSTEDTHYVCDSCLTQHLALENAKPFEEMADILDCPASSKFNCVLPRALVHSKIGSKCRQCKSRATEFEMSECRTVCDPCLKEWITTFTSDTHEVIRALPCPTHPKREECRIDQGCIEMAAGKICLVCLERKPITVVKNGPGSSSTSPRSDDGLPQAASASCNDHFVCSSCLQEYCKQQMKDKANAFSFACPASTACPNRVYLSQIRRIVGKQHFDKWQQTKVERGLHFPCRSKKCQRRQSSRYQSSPASPRITVASPCEVKCERCSTHMCLVCRQVLSRRSRSRKLKKQLVRKVGLQHIHRCKTASDLALLEHIREPRNEIRPCVQCLRLIYREEGCNHMTCGGPLGCGAEFCWVCLKPMTSVHVRCPLLSFGEINNNALGHVQSPQHSQQGHTRGSERQGSFSSLLPSLSIPHLPRATWPLRRIGLRGPKQEKDLTTVPTTILSS